MEHLSLDPFRRGKMLKGHCKNYSHLVVQLYIAFKLMLLACSKTTVGSMCQEAMESQEGHNPALEWRGKSAKPHGNRTDSIRIPCGLARIPYGFRTVLND